jgi:iron-sulfur cluster assembly accessory protein
MAVQLSAAALQRVATLTEQQSEKWLRIAIRGGGCSGLSYHMEFVPSPDEKDKTFEFDDRVKVCVDRKSYLFLNGTEIDFEETVSRTGFVYKNPQASGTCSCGTSFTL